MARTGLTRPAVVRALNEASLSRRTHGRDDLFWRLLDDFQDAGSGGPSSAAASVLLPRASWWSYWGDIRSAGPQWRALDYDDHQWMAAKGWLNRGRPGSGSRVDVWPQGSPPRGTLCLRSFFDVPEAARWRHLKLRLSCDEAAAIYLNGRPIARSRLPELIAPDAVVEAPVKNDPFSYIPEIFVTSAEPLRSGRNVVAVEIHPVAGSEQNLFFELQIEGLP
jgi:hypothetical protein